MTESPATDLPSDGSVTLLLQRMADGEDAVLDALIHEAYLRFAKRDRHLFSHRQHFFAVAARAMRQILLDEARRRQRSKRGGGAQRESLDPELLRIDEQAEAMIALDQALDKLGRIEERARTVVEHRFFAGLTESETAGLLGVDARTVRRDWAKARAWLAVELGLTDVASLSRSADALIAPQSRRTP